MKRLIILCAAAFMLFSSTASFSQCAMCKRVASTNYENEKTTKNEPGKSLNKGILYLLSVPYLIGAVGAFVWYKNKRKQD